MTSAGPAAKATPAGPGLFARMRSDRWTDLGLTLPILAVYHAGVVFLPFRNAADVVTDRLAQLAEHSLPGYLAAAGGAAAVLVAVCAWFGPRQPFRWDRFAIVAVEGAVYAVAMRAAASSIVGHVVLAPQPGAHGPLASVVLSCGAGFYEEVAFRVGLFGLGWRVLRAVRPGLGVVVAIAWAAAGAAAFSAWHYVGAEPFTLASFVFRWVCGLAFTAIFAVRGFAPAVWTHTLYDVWVMVF